MVEVLVIAFIFPGSVSVCPLPHLDNIYIPHTNSLVVAAAAFTVCLQGMHFKKIFYDAKDSKVSETPKKPTGGPKANDSSSVDSPTK